MYKEKAEVKCTDNQYPDLSIYIWLSLNVPHYVSPVIVTLLQSEDHWDFPLGAGGNEVVRQ